MVNARSFLVPFKFSQSVSYVLEFSHEKLRIYTEEGVVAIDDEITEQDNDYFYHVSYADNLYFNPLVNDGNDTELTISTPYSVDDLWDEEELCFKLQTIQHSDVLYIFSEKYPVKVLKRYSATDWRLEDLEFVDGPFCAMNTTQIALTPSAVVGNLITITANDDVFNETDVNRLIRLRGYDNNAKVWAAGVSVTEGDIFVSDNKYYLAENSGTSGSKKPVHGEGMRSDGQILWYYLHSGYGVAKIKQYVGKREVKAKVYSRLPNATLNGTVYWELGLLHGAENYPKSGAFFRNRFAFLINTKEGPKVCLSTVGDYNNFADMEYGEATTETAITVPVLNTEFNEGKWIFAGDVLFVGTGTAEFDIDVIASSSALSNENVKITKISNVGSKAIVPVAVGAHIFFADRYGLSLRDLSYNYYNDGYDQVDISLLGKHLFSSRIVTMCYQEVPDKILWCLMGDGSVTSLTFSAEQEVAALARHDFSGMAESLAVKSNMAVCHDELWLVVKRFINGKTVRSVEYMENGMPLSLPLHISKISGQEKADLAEKKFVQREAKYLDGSVLFMREVSDTRTEISGLGHLEGELVTIFADGEVRPKQLVLNGKVKIKATDTLVLVGKEIVSRYIPQAVYLDNQSGSGIGQKQCIDHVMLMMYLSGGGQIGADENHLSDILYRPANGIMGEAQTLFSGNMEILFNGKTDSKNEPALILIENTSPLPMNILAIIPYYA